MVKNPPKWLLVCQTFNSCILNIRVSIGWINIIPLLSLSQCSTLVSVQLYTCTLRHYSIYFWIGRGQGGHPYRPPPDFITLTQMTFHKDFPSKNLHILCSVTLEQARKPVTLLAVSLQDSNGPWLSAGKNLSELSNSPFCRVSQNIGIAYLNFNAPF